MARKMPLLLSTATLFASSLTPVLMVSASSPLYSEDGPWSFDELMAAEAEVQETINTECPYALSPDGCSHQHVYGGVVPHPIFAKLGNFEASQFYITSLNPSHSEKNTIEAYYRSENTFEKYSSDIVAKYNKQTGQLISKSFNGATYFHKITKLHILQVEKGHEPWSIMRDMEAGLQPYWRVLYSGVKSDDSDSLFPIDQKFTLDIDAYSFDSKYDDKLIFSYEDETGQRETFYSEMRDCHQGGEPCQMYFLNSSTEPLPYLINQPTYEEGYLDGYTAGQNAGKAMGYSDGYEAGQHEGYNAGYEAGREDGHSIGKSEGFIAGYDAGYADGDREGYEVGRDDGYSDGISDGASQGYEQGIVDGQALGYEQGFSDGQNQGYDEGYQNGHSEGYEVGYQAGLRDSNETISSDDPMPSNNDENNPVATDNQVTDLNRDTNDDNDGATDIAHPDNNVLTVSSEININNGQKGDCIKQNTNTKSRFASTPNTGTLNMDQKESAIEFPWWLGVIVLLGIASLVWLFWPNRKKSSKKS